MLPDLFQHFEALEIDTAFFMTNWLLTGFTNNMDFNIACRLWDSFLLDGEVFMMRAALGILTYFETTFLKQCHFQIKE